MSFDKHPSHSDSGVIWHLHLNEGAAHLTIFTIGAGSHQSLVTTIHTFTQMLVTWSWSHGHCIIDWPWIWNETECKRKMGKCTSYQLVFFLFVNCRENRVTILILIWNILLFFFFWPGILEAIFKWNDNRISLLKLEWCVMYF